MKQYASIFNDVIGPVMRGPSSSHTAAAVRIGMLLRQMIKGNPEALLAEFDPRGSLAATYHTQGSDIGLAGGLMGMEITDGTLLDALEIAAEKNIEIVFSIVDYEADHPNTYRMTVKSDLKEEVHVTALSVGGGMVEIRNINGLDVSITGGFFEILFFTKEDEQILNLHVAEIKKRIGNSCCCSVSRNGGEALINLKSADRIPQDIIKAVVEKVKAVNVMQLSPVLPIMSQVEGKVPFRSAEEMILFAEKENLELWQLALRYESIRGNITEDEVFERMRSLVDIMKSAVDSGLAGTQYGDRILKPQAWMIKSAEKTGGLIGGSVINSVIASVTAIMEVKSSMGIIVAAPTAGSCGCLPGTLIAAAREMEQSDDDLVKAMLGAGMIGVFIAEQATFAAEVGGCQAECGSGSGMAAAGLVQLSGGTVRMAADAASMALQNIMGMICDPVAGRVEVPCLGKNVMAGVNAVASANMALAGYDKVIPLDETITAMYEAGKMLPPELRCTGCGGLSLTETAQSISRNNGNK